jgi:hypothetical protein
MWTKLSSTVVVALLASIAVVAEQSKPAPNVVGEGPPSGAAPAPNVVARVPDPPGQLVNIKFDLTITDQTGPGEPGRKSLTLIVADRQVGYVRTYAPAKEGGQARLNVDARPHILQNGHVRVGLGLEYPSLNQQINIILEPGKPLVISQAADPTSDRKISVEVRATLLK